MLVDNSTFLRQPVSANDCNMPGHTDLVVQLKAKGIRLTPQRLLILSVISQRHSPVGVDEIFKKVTDLYPFVDIATVYRTLNLFKGLGVVTEITMGERLHFEMVQPGRKHHHMACQVCGQAFDLSTSYLDGFRKTLIQEFGFNPDLENFTVPGVCSKCGGGKRVAAAKRPSEADDDAQTSLQMG